MDFKFKLNSFSNYTYGFEARNVLFYILTKYNVYHDSIMGLFGFLLKIW